MVSLFVIEWKKFLILKSYVSNQTILKQVLCPGEDVLYLKVKEGLA